MFSKVTSFPSIFILDISVWFLVFLSFLLCLSVPGGYNFSLALLFIISVCQIFGRFFLSKKASKSDFDEKDFALISVFVLYFLSAMFTTILEGFNLRALDKPSRFLFAIPVFFLLVNKKDYRDFIWYGVLGGSILAFLIALYERFILLMPRADGFHHPIMFGNTALLLGTISFVAACYFFNKNKPYFFVLSIISGLAGISTSLLSGSRSGWAAIPLAFVFLFIFSKGLVSTKLRYSVLSILTVLSFLFWNTPSLGVTNRINQGVANFEAYFDGNTNTSIGLRLDMWHNAYNMFVENPVFGIGYNGYQEMNESLFDSGMLSEELMQFNHAHSDYLNALAQQGVVGFFFLMLIYFVPLFNFVCIMKNNNLTLSSRYFAMAGALIPICYMGFALSQTMFSHNIGVMLYAFFIVFFWVASKHSKKII